MPCRILERAVASNIKCIYTGAMGSVCSSLIGESMWKSFDRISGSKTHDDMTNSCNSR